MKPNRWLALWGALILCVSSPAFGAVHIIKLINFSITPLNTAVYLGDTVKWIASGTHTSTSNLSSPKSWNSGIVGGSGFSLRITGSDPTGNYPYHCELHNTMQDTLRVRAPLNNSKVNLLSSGGSDQINSAVALHELTVGETYALWTEFPGPGLTPPVIGSSFSSFGPYGNWVSLVYPSPPAPYTQQWNPTIASVFPGISLFGGFIAANAAFAGSPRGSGQNAIIANITTGAGAAFGTSPTATVATNSPGLTWHDFPTIISDDFFANSVATRGTAHLIWTTFVEGGDGDPNGDGDRFNDPADGFVINYAYTSTINFAPFPPIQYPAFSTPLALFSASGSHWPSQSIYKPTIDVVGTHGTPTIPSGGVFAAWLNPSTSKIMVDASTTPGAAWGALGSGSPIAPQSFVALPSTISPGVEASSTVSIAISNDSAGPCPGAIYLSWGDYRNGDADVYFSASFGGGLMGTWTTPIRVNQDQLGNGRDQWAPSIKVSPATGEIRIVYYDRRKDADNIAFQTWESRSTDCGVTWKDFVLSDTVPAIPHTSYTLASPFRGIYSQYLGSDFNKVNGPAAIWNDGRNNSNEDIFFETGGASDIDTDGTFDYIDNCMTTYNPDQLDSDGDGWGNACDNCPFRSQLSQTDTDGDGRGDVCDNCPTLADTSQVDSDGDGIGNLCDNCPNTQNLFQTNSDGDSFGDACDNCPLVTSPSQTDSDGDGDGDLCDNCLTIANPSQANADGDSLGDACDPCPSTPDSCVATCCTPPIRGDANHNGALNVLDLNYLVAYFFNSGPIPPCNLEADVNGNGALNVIDLNALVAYFFNGGSSPALCP